MIRAAAAIAVFFGLVGVGSAGAATLQPIGSFESPMYVTSAPENPDRLFVVERKGRIKMVQAGVVSNFADLSSVVGCCEGERGLQSLALAPDFETSGRLYVDYTDAAGDIHVAEMRSIGGVAPLSSLRDLLTIPHPLESNHFGGQLQFGPEGNLFIATGDGGGVGDPHQNAQSLAVLLGKILRIGPNPSGVAPYPGITIPAGNPYGGSSAPIWSLGLRNPYRFSFDRGNGGLWIGDVGQSAREEVDYAAPGSAGANYGWNCLEGSLPGPATDPECATLPLSAFTAPVFEYGHEIRGGTIAGCAIVGGYVVRDSNLAGLYGRYLYTDFCEGQLRSFDPSKPASSDRAEGLAVAEPVSFGQDSCGRLLVVAAGGTVSRLVGTSAACPPPAAAADDRAASLINIKALSGRRIERGKRAQIVAWVAPCKDRRGDRVKLLRGNVPVGSRLLDRACSIRFRPKITRRMNFRAVIGENEEYLSATSRKLRIKVAKPRKHRR